MEPFLYYLFPFFKNLTVLCLTIWLVMLGNALRKSGIDGFVFRHWLEENNQRFISGFTFVFSLSLLMAMADVAPLFKFFGYDINASPVGLGLSISALIIAGISTGGTPSRKAQKAKKIQKDAAAITKTAAEIVEEDKKGDKQDGKLDI